MILENKIVWITGASSGIGEAVAVALAKKKAKLILTSRNKEELERVKSSCLKFTNDCEILPYDVTALDQLENTCDKAINFFGRVDILINNAGISQRSFAIETPLEIDRKVMEIDFFGTVALTKALLPHFIQNKSGHLVVISSIAGKFGFPLRTAYSAAKHALIGFFESLRIELKDVPVNVTIVCPGRIRTKISVNAITSDGKQHGAMDKGQLEGMDVDKCAHQIIQSIIQNKKEVLIGGKEVLMVYIKRFLPSLFYKIINKVKPE